jgi:hypothetical protein
MPIFEAEQEGEFIADEPPPLGSAAYRRIILNVCATHTKDEFDAAIEPVFQWRGWRCAVEVMVELIGALSINVPDRCVDAFGNVRLDDVVSLLDDDFILRQAHELAPKAHPGLPRHEALAESIREGEELRDLLRSLAPYWDEAATVLRPAVSLADMDKGRAVFTRWLNAHYKDRRVWAACLGASATHLYWRTRAMPMGNEWVEDMVNPPPDLSGSLAWTVRAGVGDLRRMQPELVDGWKSAGRSEKRRSKKRGCCPDCGKKRR